MRRLYYFYSLINLFVISSCEKQSVQEKQKVTIGALLSLTGNWSTLGITSKESIQQAITDINDYLIKNGSNYEFSAAIYDTKLDTLTAINALKNANAAGIRYFIGPQSSAELNAIREFAGKNNLLIVSQGSTASSLAIPNDGIFRFCPGDSIEGNATAVTIKSLGIEYLISMSRDDAGNKGLQRSVSSKFAAMGGQVSSISPYPTTQTDFTSLLSTLKPILQSAITAKGASKVGVYLGSFDECVQIFKQASLDPVYSSVQWFGGDGVVLSEALINDNQASAFASATKFFAPTFGLPMSAHPDLERVVSVIKSKSNIQPDAYAISTYDATWVIANCIIKNQNTNATFSDFLSLFQMESRYFYGLSGPIQLNGAGDRSNGSFDYWGVVAENGIYKWKYVGKSL